VCSSDLLEGIEFDSILHAERSVGGKRTVRYVIYHIAASVGVRPGLYHGLPGKSQNPSDLSIAQAARSCRLTQQMGEPIAMLDLANVKRHAKPNQYLVLPAGFGVEKPNETGPVFAASASALWDAWRKMITAQPRVRILEEMPDRHEMELYQRTPLLRFRDDVTVQIVPVNDTTASIAIYSRSRIGYSDMGTNAKRVKQWLSQLKAAVPA